MNRSFRG